MKKSKVLLVILTMIVSILSGQESLTLTFSGRRGFESYQKIDYLTVKNTTRNWQDVLYYPDTTFILAPLSGVENISDSDLISIFPNPIHGEARIDVEMPVSSNLIISVFEVTGAECARYQSNHAAGHYAFSLQLQKQGLYLLSISMNDFHYATKVNNIGNNGHNRIDLIYNNETYLVLSWDPIYHPFEYGDIMEYVGYVDKNGIVEESDHVIKPQFGDEDIILQFDVLTPEVTTANVTDITQTSAVGGGKVTYSGGASVTERGICWNTSHYPTIDDYHISCGEGSGEFSARLTELDVNTTYYVRSYAVNSAGIGYGDEVSFTTTAYLPIVTTFEVTDITQTTAISGGEVTYNGGANITERGICWGTNPEPTIECTHVSCGDGIGCFSGQLTGLSINTNYYVRSYAVNSAGISYGNEKSFTTPPITDIKILSIGNSYSCDALSYVPFILENMNVDANIQIGILCMGGADLNDHVYNFENQIPNYYYFHYNGGGAWQYLGQQTIQYALDNYDWDIITLQQVSHKAANWTTYQPSLNNIISLIIDYINTPVKFGWYMVQSRPATGINGSNYTDETIVANYVNIAANAQRVLGETACEFVIPVGTAIQNARTIHDIKALGDYSNIEENTSGLGYLEYDGIHLQEGLPCQIAAYSFVLSILEQYGGLEAYSIIGESTRVTPEWISGKQIPGSNGVPIGSDDTNCLTGQRCAVEAFNKPYEITDMNK